MTEDEALSKWCPQMVSDPLFRSSATNSPGTRCIASACMAWRWIAPEIQRRWTAEGDPSPGPDWQRDTAIRPPKDGRFSKLFWRRNPQGRCGLAGVPQ